MISPITIQVVINAPIQTIWECWTLPEHITQWTFATSDWEAPSAENDVRKGGKFVTKMAAKDGSQSFDFCGVYTAIQKNERIEYDMDDGRHVSIYFESAPHGVKVTQTFDPENENTQEMQESGWQSILDNFKKYVESRV